MTLHTAKPGIIIGRGGKGVDDLRAVLEHKFKKSFTANVTEIRHPELDAQLVSESIAQQISKRISYKRAMRQAVTRAMKLGAKGIRILCSGRLNGSEMARKEGDRLGKIPLHTLRADIDYGFSEAATTYGNIGVKVWIYKGRHPARPEASDDGRHCPAAAAAASPECRRRLRRRPVPAAAIAAGAAVRADAAGAAAPVDAAAAAVDLAAVAGCGWRRWSWAGGGGGFGGGAPAVATAAALVGHTGRRI